MVAVASNHPIRPSADTLGMLIPEQRVEAPGTLAPRRTQPWNGKAGIPSNPENSGSTTVSVLIRVLLRVGVLLLVLVSREMFLPPVLLYFMLPLSFLAVCVCVY